MNKKFCDYIYVIVTTIWYFLTFNINIVTRVISTSLISLKVHMLKLILEATNLFPNLRQISAFQVIAGFYYTFYISIEHLASAGLYRFISYLSRLEQGSCIVFINFQYKSIFFSNRSLGFILRISQISVYSDSWKPCCISLNLQKYLALKILKVWFIFLLACLTEKGIGSVLAHVFIYTCGEIVPAGRVEVILTMQVYNPASTVIHELKT